MTIARLAGRGQVEEGVEGRLADGRADDGHAIAAGRRAQGHEDDDPQVEVIGNELPHVGYG